MHKTESHNNQFRQRPRPADNTSFLIYAAKELSAKPILRMTQWERQNLAKLLSLIEITSSSGIDAAKMDAELVRLEALLGRNIQVRELLRERWRTSLLQINRE